MHPAMNCNSIRLPLLCSLLVAPIVAGCATPPQKFDNPEQAANALVQAARDQSTDQLKRILGSDSDDVVSSGDPVADQQALNRFVEAYDQKHHLVRQGDGSVSLLVGQQDWPLPIPIVKHPRNDTWHFDTDAGRDEVVNRRIGRNELDAIQTCLAIVDAQREYARLDPQGIGLPVYAARFASQEGAKDGLYWPTGDEEPPSPMGPMVASATEEGYTLSESDSPEPRPYHGYMFRLLTSQGPSAPGGQREYMIDGRLLGGFGIVAFPADYENSGIMTFIVNQEGVVYERDLGPGTDAIARKMTSFDPGPDWEKVRKDDAAKL